jgi:hypothetical protein
MDLSELYYYDATSPTFLRWNKDIFSGRYHNHKNVSKGDVAGGMGNSGYYQVRVSGRLTLVHRVIWELLNGEIPDGMFIDHIDQNKLNNDIQNLRLVTKASNNRNQKLRVDSSSGVVGVNRLVNKLGNGNIAEYWKAVWFDDGIKYKAFSIKKYGEDVAFKMACDFREKMIQELNDNGAGYTENHGK